MLEKGLPDLGPRGREVTAWEGRVDLETNAKPEVPCG